MYTDYKIVEEREENGIIYQKVRFYEGAITTEDETRLDPATGEVVTEPTERYRRTVMYEEVEYQYDAV